MKSKLFWKFIVGFIVILSLILLFIWSDNIANRNSGPAYQTEKIIRSILLLTTAWITTRFITLIFLDPINAKRKKNLPNIVKDIIGALIYFIAISIILVEVYGQTIANIGAFFISSWAIIGFAAKDLIADCINGISLDLQADFELGDWIQFKDGTIGKIIEMKMTGVDILLPNNTILFISNTMLNSDPMINLSKPENNYYIAINVILEHSIPVARARRILLAAAVSSNGVFNHDAKVFSESVQENGVVYVIYFKVPDRSVWLESRHQVIQNITEYLHKFNLKVCQITGEINVNSDTNTNKKIAFNDNYTTPPLFTLKLSKLLEGCDKATQIDFSKYMKLRKFHNGESIVKQGERGDSMFIIAEGVVDIDISVTLNNEDQKEIKEYRAACLVDGEYFGETALLLGEKRNATVKARTDVVLYEIDRSAVKYIAENHPDFIDKLSNTVAKNELKNRQLQEEVIKQKNEDEKTISELVEAFKKYLWDH